MGMPSSGRFSPRESPASAARAASRPRSKSRTQIALIFASWRSLRAMTSFASSTADTFFVASADVRSTEVWKLHCDLVKAFSRSFSVVPDDAQFACMLQGGQTQSDHRPFAAESL